MKNIFIIAVISLVAGCMNIDYTGKKFSPTAKTVLCTDRQKIYLDEYTLVGRFEVSARPKVHPYQIEDALLEKSRQYGGDLLFIMPGKMTVNGVYQTNSQEFGTPQAHKATAKEEKLFGKSAPLAGRNVTFPRRKCTALLYKKSTEVKRQPGL